MTPPAIPTDRRGAALEPTGELDALDLPDAAHAGANDPPAAPGRYLLVEQDGERRTLALTRAMTHLGRGFAATLQLEDLGVSRRHAIVVQRRGGARILDDRSANGTWVNGRRVLEAQLHDGDVIVLGRVVLVYREVVDGAGAPPPQAA